MGPDDLPKFAITAICDDFCTGRFDQSPWVGENWIAGVYNESHQLIWGRFHRVNSIDNTCDFCPDEVADLSKLQTGRSYPYIDGYWGERAELALDPGRQWKETAFEPSDMVQFPAEGGGRLATRLSSNAPSGGEVVPGGWDHEHCDICWKKIGCGGEPFGFYSDPNAWVCSECYTKHVTPRSIEFAGMEKEWFSEGGTWQSRTWLSR